MKVRHVHDRKAKHPKTHNSPRRFTVDLSEGEVDFLIALTEGIGGDGKNSPRKYANRIHEALTDASGYMAGETDAYRMMRGALWFTDYGTEPSARRAVYNHIRDSVTMYSLLGHAVTGIKPWVMDLMAESADDIATELQAEGETIDGIPVPTFGNQARPARHRRTVLVRAGGDLLG